MNRITSTIVYGNNAEHLDEWQQSAHPWTITLRYQGRQYTFPFWTGAMAGKPDTFAAAQCVILDATGYDNARSFEEWATDYGYDEDSRKAERGYRAVEKEYKNVRRLIGNDWDEIASLEEDELQRRCK